MSWVPKIAPKLGNLLEDSVILIITARIFTGKGYKAKSANRKDIWHKIRGDLAQLSKTFLPVETHRLNLIPPAASVTTM